MIRPARPDDLPARPVYGAARRFMAEHGNPTSGATATSREDLEADLQRGELYVFDQDGVIHGPLSSAWDEPNYRVIEGPGAPAHPMAPSTR